MTSYLLFLLILSHKSHSLTPSHKSALVFSPHQDDETLGCGGTIALKRELGVPVKVIFLTDGRYGSLQPMALEEIINIRKQEAVTALGILGVAPSDIQFLDRVDGSLDNLPAEERQNLIEQLAQLLIDFMPEEIYVPHRQDFHPDHEATYQLVQAAIAKSRIKVDLLQYPIWILWQNPLSLQIRSKDIAGAYRLAINSVQQQKHQAIETYKSQIPGLTRGFLRRFFSPYELFFKD
jgi:LmbE family N-acetylglucosaminyl deacetylase